MNTLFGSALAAAGRSDQAEKALREALRLDPDDCEAREQLRGLRTARSAGAVPPSPKTSGTE